MTHFFITTGIGVATREIAFSFLLDDLLVGRGASLQGFDSCLLEVVLGRVIRVVGFARRVDQADVVMALLTHPLEQRLKRVARGEREFLCHVVLGDEHDRRLVQIVENISTCLRVRATAASTGFVSWATAPNQDPATAPNKLATTNPRPIRLASHHLIILNGILFLANAFFGGPQQVITRTLMLQSDALVHPWMWYQFLTAGFVHDWNNPLHIVGNMLGLYCFGPRLEEKYGSREFLRFYLIAIVLGFIVWSAEHYLFARSLLATQPELARKVLEQGCYGASGGVTAAVVLFCVLYPRATLLASFLFPVPAWLMGILIVAGNLFGTVHSSPLLGGVAYDVHLVVRSPWPTGILDGASAACRAWTI